MKLDVYGDPWYTRKVIKQVPNRLSRQPHWRTKVGVFLIGSGKWLVRMRKGPRIASNQPCTISMHDSKQEAISKYKELTGIDLSDKDCIIK